MVIILLRTIEFSLKANIFPSKLHFHVKFFFQIELSWKIEDCAETA